MLSPLGDLGLHGRWCVHAMILLLLPFILVHL
jgi:hypothetical protein